jgi:hypothetical protein
MAVMKAGGSNLNQELVSQGLARYREDVGGAEGQAMHGWLGRMLGRAGESASFTGELFVMYRKWHLITVKTRVFSLALRFAIITIHCRLTALKRINTHKTKQIPASVLV